MKILLMLILKLCGLQLGTDTQINASRGAHQGIERRETKAASYGHMQVLTREEPSCGMGYSNGSSVKQN